MFSKKQRFEGIKRNYSQEDVEKLRGSLKNEYTLARRGSIKLWDYLTRGGDSYIKALGALTGKADCDEFKGAVSRNSAKLGNYKMPVKLIET